MHRKRQSKLLSSMLANVLVALTIILSASARETTVFYVFSDDQPASAFNQCQVTNSCSLVALLSSNILSYNISNTEVILHPGVHTINNTINQVFSVNNATTFTLTAAKLGERSTIKCSGRTGFAFSFCKKLTIHGINFESCTGRHHQVTNMNKKIYSVTLLCLSVTQLMSISRL